MSELRKIPNVGKATERDLIAMGYTTKESRKGKTADELYAEECALRGFVLDRCQLYLYRAVEYFVGSDNPDPEKCKWWHWKDEYVDPSPCGAVCVSCARFPAECKGCRSIKGKVHWLKYTGADVCPVYGCCSDKGLRDCGECESLPCDRFTKDPTVSDEQNEANLRAMIANLKKRRERDERI